MHLVLPQHRGGKPGTGCEKTGITYLYVIQTPILREHCQDIFWLPHCVTFSAPHAFGSGADTACSPAMQILDDGRVTDSQGRTGSFKNTILIMTSNLGSQAILEGMSAGQRDAVKDTVMSMVCPWTHIFVPSKAHSEPCKTRMHLS